MKGYVEMHMKEDMPDNEVVMAGGNDIGRTNSPDIANKVIEAGIYAKLNGASKVFISSVLPRRCISFQGRRHELNKLLKSQCTANKFVFMEHNNIRGNM